MPQLEKTLKIDLGELETKIMFGFFSCPMTSQRGRWETTVNGVKTVLIVYEQHAEPTFVKPPEDKMPEWMKEWPDDYSPSWANIYAREFFQQKPHYSIAITLVQNGDEIKLCAITSGSGQNQVFYPECGGEFGLFETLDLTLSVLDDIIL